MTPAVRRRKTRARAMSVALLLLAAASTPSQPVAPRGEAERFLFAITVGNRVVQACATADPHKMRDDPTVLAAARALDVDTSQVEFLGCVDTPYMVSERSTPVGFRYTVRYPSNQPDGHVGPIIHELAHLHQFRVYGGMESLKRELTQSKQIELSADFVAGLVFANSLSGVDRAIYERGISTMGRYYEQAHDAHGSPEERTAAFRRGYYFTLSEDVPDLDAAALHFHEDIYAKLVAR